MGDVRPGNWGAMIGNQTAELPGRDSAGLNGKGCGIDGRMSDGRGSDIRLGAKGIEFS
jgi:hypothetical protein